MNVTNKQWISIAITVLGVLMVSTSQLTDLFGPVLAKDIVSIAAILNTILGGVMTTITSQGSIVRDVQAMPGVEAITVNPQANKTLASLAIDPAQPKIDTAPGAADVVSKTAKGVV